MELESASDAYVNTQDLIAIAKLLASFLKLNPGAYTRGIRDFYPQKVAMHRTSKGHNDIIGYDRLKFYLKIYTPSPTQKMKSWVRHWVDHKNTVLTTRDCNRSLPMSFVDTKQL